MKTHTLITLSLGFIVLSCRNSKDEYDASGSFEAIETVISAEANGKLLAFQVEEGQVLEVGQQIGYIDSTQLYLNKLQLLQNQKAILSGRPDVQTQIESLQKELNNALEDKTRLENLVKGNVASQKQLDDVITRCEVIQSRIDALKSSLNTNSNVLNEQANTVQIQLMQVKDQLLKCRIINPVKGTVLTKYAEQNEMTSAGKPLYKIADLSNMVLRAYVSGDQLPGIQLNQQVKVLTDDGKGAYKESQGLIIWISVKGEFTPKTIQTKNERANMVYAIKVKVANDGTFKIGMYGEIKF